MADNPTVINSSGNTGSDYVVATDDDGTAHHQLVKMEWGADGTRTPVSTGTSALPVQGSAAGDAPGTGNPLLIGGLSFDTTKADVSTDGDAVWMWLRANGSVVVGTESTSTAPTVTRTADAASSTQIAASNTSRRKLLIHNDSDQICYVHYGATASSTAYVAKLYPQETLIDDSSPIYTGAINAIWAANSTGSANVTEWTT